MTTSLGFPGVSQLLPNEKEHRSELAAAINRINRGKLNCTIDITLNVSTTSTILVDARIGKTSYVDFMPQTASAATAKQSIYITNRGNGSLTVNHASNAATDQTFTCVILG